MSDEVSNLRAELESARAISNGFLHKIQQQDNEIKRLTTEKAAVQRKLDTTTKQRDKAVLRAARLMSQTNALQEVAVAYRVIARTSLSDGLTASVVRTEFDKLDNIRNAAQVYALYSELLKKSDSSKEIAALLDGVAERFGMGVLELISPLGEHSSNLLDHNNQSEVIVDDADSDQG